MVILPAVQDVGHELSAPDSAPGFARPGQGCTFAAACGADPVLLSAIPTLITIVAGVAVFAFSLTWQPGDDSLLLPFLGVVGLGVLAAGALWSGMIGWAILLGFRRVAGYAAMPGTVQGLLAFLAGGLTGVPIMIVMYQQW